MRMDVLIPLSPQLDRRSRYEQPATPLSVNRLCDRDTREGRKEGRKKGRKEKRKKGKRGSGKWERREKGPIGGVEVRLKEGKKEGREWKGTENRICLSKRVRVYGCVYVYVCGGGGGGGGICEWM